MIRQLDRQKVRCIKELQIERWIDGQKCRQIDRKLDEQEEEISLPKISVFEVSNATMTVKFKMIERQIDR